MTPYEAVHATRFVRSLNWLGDVRGLRVLELGGSSVFTKMMEAQGAKVSHVGGDLRTVTPYADIVGTFDLVLCMEVIEHIADREPEPGTFSDSWRGDGVASMLAFARAMLKPEGRLFLTTPNACSYTVIWKILHLQPPMIWRPHVREYSPYELDEIVRAAGFTITRRETLDVWMNAIAPEAQLVIRRFIEDRIGRVDSALRGEDIFLLATRA